MGIGFHDASRYTTRDATQFRDAWAPHTHTPKGTVYGDDYLVYLSQRQSDTHPGSTPASERHQWTQDQSEDEPAARVRRVAAPPPVRSWIEGSSQIDPAREAEGEAAYRAFTCTTYCFLSGRLYKHTVHETRDSCPGAR